MKCIIVAYDKNRLIGGNKLLPWQGDMRSDMRRFRELTSGNVVIMGRKTFESIGHALNDRQNIVVTRQKTLQIEGVQIANSLNDAYLLAEPNKDIFIIGGGQIFEQSIDAVDKILATEIDATFKGDVYFPALSDVWHQITRQNCIADVNNKYNYSFVTYSRGRI